MQLRLAYDQLCECYRAYTFHALCLSEEDPEKDRLMIEALQNSADTDRTTEEE